MGNQPWYPYHFTAGCSPSSDAHFCEKIKNPKEKENTSVGHALAIALWFIHRSIHHREKGRFNTSQRDSSHHREGEIQNIIDGFIKSHRDNISEREKDSMHHQFIHKSLCQGVLPVPRAPAEEASRPRTHPPCLGHLRPPRATGRPPIPPTRWLGNQPRSPPHIG